MIDYIKGILEYIGSDYIVVENNGLGYHINVSATTAVSAGSIGDEIKLHTYMSVKEDDISIYGFLKADELDMFKLLIGVSGVGPKSAIALLGVSGSSQLVLAIMTDDYSTLSSAPGIGKKTAQRIALELKDKLKSTAATPIEVAIAAPQVSESDTRNDAIEGLMALGFTKSESTKAVDAIYEARLDASQLISRALRVVK
jgi:Holliday junction DNA helicase RuvA